jgi:3-mercaptopyruvate sulfurtransferase SseA
MKRKFLLPATLALVAAAAALLGACKATDTAGNLSAPGAASQSAGKAAPAAKTAPATPADGARRIDPAELQQMLEGGRAVVYDTRARASYEQEHIKGALSLPHEEVAARAGELPKDKTLVFYCT